ncbi:MAG TPA: PASTA domain-containing protein [Gaiellaceae bacterium]|nr:PASTA domain-containing protein [Gaiellaceae bacterium]
MTETRTPPPDDRWPTPEAETGVIARDSDTLVGGAPPPVAPPPAPAAGPPPDRRIGAGMLLGIVAILLVAAGIAIAWYLTHNGSDKQTTTVVVTTAPKKKPVAKVAVPRVIGMKEPKAIARLASVGLRPKEVYKPTSKSKGIVVSQTPQEATQLAKGKQVTIVIDSGAPKAKVPDLTGQSVSDAQSALDQLGLDSTITKVTSDKPAGTVVDQAPNAGGKLAKGSSVTLSVAKAKPKAPPPAPAMTTSAQQTTPTTTAAAPPQPQSATVPNVTGQDEASAVQALGEAGILPSIVFVPGKDPLGTIEQQAKPAGSSVPFHDHVQINASSGPGNKPQAQVPNVIGKSLNEAVAAMQGAHLRLIYLKFPVSSKEKAGEIVQQTPLGGGSAPQNAQVLVFLAAYQG